MIVLGLVILISGAVMAKKYGWEITKYVAFEIASLKTDIFQKEKLPIDDYDPGGRYRVPGLLLKTEKNDIWLLTIYGVQHFTPVTDRRGAIFRGKNICQYMDEINSNMAKSGKNSFEFSEMGYSNITDWLHDATVGKRKYIRISYLAEDEKKAVKRYRYAYASDALSKVHTGENMCP